MALLKGFKKQMDKAVIKACQRFPAGVPRGFQAIQIGPGFHKQFFVFILNDQVGPMLFRKGRILRQKFPFIRSGQIKNMAVQADIFPGLPRAGRVGNGNLIHGAGRAGDKKVESIGKVGHKILQGLAAAQYHRGRGPAVREGPALPWAGAGDFAAIFADGVPGRPGLHGRKGILRQGQGVKTFGHAHNDR